MDISEDKMYVLLKLLRNGGRLVYGCGALPVSYLMDFEDLLLRTMSDSQKETLKRVTYKEYQYMVNEYFLKDGKWLK